MHRIEADFNDLARGGKVRLDVDEAPTLQLGARVVLADPSEGIAFLATLAEASDSTLYFELVKRITGTVGYFEISQASVVAVGSTSTIGGIPQELTHVVTRPSRSAPVRVEAVA